MSSFLDNVVSYGTEAFLSNEKYQSMLFEIIQFSIFYENFGEFDQIHLCKLIESVLLNCRGKVDYFLPNFINFGLHLLRKEPKTVSGKVHVMQLLINCVLYNAQMSISILEQQDGLILFFTNWFEYSNLFKQVYDKKLCVLAINKILALPFDSLPAVLQSGYPKLMIVAASMLDTLPEAYKKRKEEEDEYKNGASAEPDALYDQDDYEDDEEDIEYDSNEQVAPDGPEFIGFDDEDSGDE